MSIINFFRKYFCCGKNIVCKKLFLRKARLNPSLYSRIGYISLFSLSIIYCLLLKLTDDEILSYFKPNLECNENSKDSIYTCLEISSVYRISFAFLLLHMICAIIALSGSETLKIISQNEIWPLKFFFLAVVYYLGLCLSNNIFNKYAMLAKFISVFYLLYQLILNIYFAHLLNIILIHGFDNYKAKSRYKYSIIGFTLIFFLISIYFIVLSIFNAENTWYNLLLISFNITFSLINAFISISDLVENKRLLTSICIFSYTCYLTWSAINSEPTINYQYKNGQDTISNGNVTISSLFSNAHSELEPFIDKIFMNSSLIKGLKNVENDYNIYYNYMGLSYNGNFTNNTNNEIDKKFIIDISEALFGLIYVLLALIFIGFFSKKNYYNCDPFGTDSEIGSQINNISLVSYDSVNQQQEKILEECPILVDHLQFRYSDGKLLI